MMKLVTMNSSLVLHCVNTDEEPRLPSTNVERNFGSARSKMIELPKEHQETEDFTAMEMTTGPMFTLYVVWHPLYREGQADCRPAPHALWS